MNHLRPLLATYAYNITGSHEASLDIVQDAFLKFLQVDSAHIINERAYLVRSVINLAINYKKQSQRLQNEYPGVWLPEPVDTQGADSTLNKKDILSYSLMVLLEKLNPRQRAVFILKEAFDYSHEEIAIVLETTVDNSRQLLKRAKQSLKQDGKVPGLMFENLNSPWALVTVPFCDPSIKTVARSMASFFPFRTVPVMVKASWDFNMPELIKIIKIESAIRFIVKGLVIEIKRI